MIFEGACAARGIRMEVVSPPFRSYVSGLPRPDRPQLPQRPLGGGRTASRWPGWSRRMPTDTAPWKFPGCFGGGAKWLAVSSVDEGVNLRVRGHPPDADPGDGRDFCPTRAMRWWNTISRRWSIRSNRCARWRVRVRSGKAIPYHLKIDSGMGRLGTRAGAAKILTLSRAAHARGWKA